MSPPALRAIDSRSYMLVLRAFAYRGRILSGTLAPRRARSSIGLKMRLSGRRFLWTTINVCRRRPCLFLECVCTHTPAATLLVLILRLLSVSGCCFRCTHLLLEAKPEPDAERRLLGRFFDPYRRMEAYFYVRVGRVVAGAHPRSGRRRNFSEHQRRWKRGEVLRGHLSVKSHLETEVASRKFHGEVMLLRLLRYWRIFCIVISQICCEMNTYDEVLSGCEGGKGLTDPRR